MNCYDHTDHADSIVNHFKKHNIECQKEVIIGERRVDVKCGETNIEVKNTCIDLTSVRSKEQIHDMKRYADSHHEGFVISTPCNCLIPKNEKGHEFIRKHNLVECPREQEFHCCSEGHELA